MGGKKKGRGFEKGKMRQDRGEKRGATEKTTDDWGPGLKGPIIELKVASAQVTPPIGITDICN